MPVSLRNGLSALSRRDRALAVLGLFLLLASLALALAATPAGHPRARYIERHAALWFAAEQPVSALAARGPFLTEAALAGPYLLLSEGRRHYYVHLPGPWRDGASLRALLPPGLPVHALADGLAPGATRARLGQGLALAGLALLAVLGGLLLQRRLAPFRVLRPARDDAGFERIVGAGAARAALEDVVRYLRDGAAYARLGAAPPRGVLLEGPPGTGKTLLARALAAEAGAAFIALSGSDFSSQFVGAGVARVRQLFRLARAEAPCIVFIDEIDGLGRRGGDDSAAAAENNRIINALLVELDGFHRQDGVIVVGATNFAERLDPGLRREGRFDRSCRLGLPDRASREELFRREVARLAAAAGREVAAELDLALLARLSTGLAPAAIAAVVNAAAVQAASAGAPRLATAHLQRALERHRLGDPATPGPMDDALRHRIAVHEAGHALVGHLALPAVRVEKVSVLPQGGALGVTLFSEAELPPLATAAELRGRLEMILAGRAAEILQFGEASTGAAQDLQQATRLAIAMAGAYSADAGAPALALEALPPVLQESGGRAVTAAAQAILEAAHGRVLATLEAHGAVLQRLVRALLERDEVAGEALDQLLGPRPVVAQPRPLPAMA